MEKLFTLQKGRILLLVLMLFLGFSKVLADDSGLITEQIKINVGEAGTLCDRIKSDLKYKITSLKLSGELNIDDIQYIREMAGCYYDTIGSKYDGHLKDLDMKDVTLVVTYKSIVVYYYDGYDEANSTPIGTSNFATFYSDESMGYALFAYLPMLQSVVLPKGLIDVGRKTFSHCSHLTSVTLPPGLLWIDTSAFENCTGLTSLQFPSSLNSIEGWAFSGCTGLTSLQFPSNLTSIGLCAFEGCSGLTTLQFPSSLNSIEGWAFRGCTGLTSLQFPTGLTSIGKEAFWGCTGLTSLDLPAGLTSIGSSAFGSCLITSIHAYMPNPPLIEEDASPFPPDLKNNCTLYVPKDSYTAYMVAPGWGDFKTIAKFNPDLIRDWVTKNVAQAGTLSTVIGEDKENIQKLKLTGNLNDTDVHYLEEMIREADLQELDLKDAQLYAIESLWFSDCKNLTSLVLPDVLQQIEKGAFLSCTGLTTISLPAGLEYMYGAFCDCTGLTSIYANMPTPLQDAHSFLDIDKNNCILYVPKGSRAAYRQMGDDWGLFPHIVEFEFDSATGLLTLDVQANGVGSLSNQVDAALRGRVKNLKISGQIGNSDFDFINKNLSENLQNLDLKDANVADLPYCGLDECQTLTTISLPAGLRSIDKGFLSLCRNLKTIYAYMPDPDALTYGDNFNFESREWTLYVPKGTKNAYQNSQEWCYCKEIIEMETSGIDSVILNPDAKEVSRFSADGQRLAVPVKGLNIVKYSDGSARKVVVK